MTARSLVEGLYGITPKALDHQLLIRPGFPKHWDNASIVLLDIDFSFTRKGQTDQYLIQNKFAAKMDLLLKLPAEAAEIVSVLVNGKPSKWVLQYCHSMEKTSQFTCDSRAKNGNG
jgi:hypothetical protein